MTLYSSSFDRKKETVMVPLRAVHLQLTRKLDVCYFMQRRYMLKRKQVQKQVSNLSERQMPNLLVQEFLPGPIFKEATQDSVIYNMIKLKMGFISYDTKWAGVATRPL